MAANAAVDLTTVDKVKARLGLAGVAIPPGDEGELQRLVTLASARMHSEIGSSIIYASRVDTKDGNGGRRIWLDDCRPGSGEDLWYCTVATVVVDGVSIPASPTEGFAEVDDSRIDLFGSYRFTSGYGNVVITYTAGFKVTPWGIPQDIEGAVIEYAALLWKEKDRLGQTYKVVSGEVTDFRGSQVWATFLAVAAAYHRPTVA